MKLASRLRTGDDAPLLMLDALRFGHAQFEPAETRWFEATPLLGIARQTRQALEPDVLVLPLLEWVRAWWRAHLGSPPQGPRPDRILRTATEKPELAAALREAVLALAAGGALAVGIDGAKGWLGWAGAPAASGMVGEGDAEDVSVYLAALLQKLPAESIGAVLVRDCDAVEGSAEAGCEPLLNAAHHLGWAAVQCAAAGERRLDGFDAFASPHPDADAGWNAPSAFWEGAAQPQSDVPFVCSTILSETPVREALAALATLRSRAPVAIHRGELQ